MRAPCAPRPCGALPSKPGWPGGGHSAFLPSHEEAADMAIAGTQRGAPSRVAHTEESFSILMALAAAAGSVIFFWFAPSFEPESHIAWTIPGWIAGAYLFLQIFFL